MNSKIFSYIMIGVVIILSGGILGITFSGKTLLDKQSQKLSDARAQDQVINQQEVSLAQAKSDILKYDQLDEIAKAIVPQDKNQAKTVREINNIAAESGVNLQQINFNTSDLGIPGNKTTGKLTQVKPVEGIEGVYSLEITVSSGEASPVPYYKFLDFLERLESNRRTAHVSSIIVTPSENNKNDVNFSLVLNVYLKP